MDTTALQQLAAQQRDAREAAREFADAVRRNFHGRVEWIRLFGSLARGDWMGPDESDVDVAIVIRNATPVDAREIVRLASGCTWSRSVVITPKIFAPAEFADLQQRELRLARDILGEGILL